MDDEKLLQIADDQLNFLDRMSALHQRRMLDSIQALEKRIVDRASALKTSESGNLLGAKTNLAQAQKVHSDMTALFDEEYGAASRETVKEYSESLPVIQQQYEEMGEAVKYTGVDRDMVKGLKSMDLAAYASYGLAAQDKIASAVYNHVIAKAPFSALVGEIAAALTGQKDKRGRPLANYAKQMANDGIMNFHNTVNLKKAEDAKFEHYLYVGNIIADSRPFCIARAGNVYTREQIDSWTGTWQGKSGPAFTHRGGYNCRHHWQPVRKEWIPEGGIEVQSWFDRAGVMPVSKLPKSVTGAPKFKAWQAWQQSVLIGKKPLDAAAVAKAAGVPKSAASGWLSQWQRGYNLPQGWQSVVRDLEAKAGGFERAGDWVVEPLPGKTAVMSRELSPLLPDGWDKARKNLMDSAENILKARGYSGDIDEFIQEVYNANRDEVEEKLQKAVDDSAVWMAIKEPTLRNNIISKKGTFKNSLETGKGSFKTISDARAVKEREMFGISAALDDYDKWPKYGFLSDAKSMTNPKLVGFGYGDTFVRFKQSVKSRTMFTIGDSYNNNMKFKEGMGEGWGRIAPSVPVTKANADALMSSSIFQRGYLGKGRLHGAASIDEFAAAVEYAEAQVYGKLDYSDMDAIYTSSKKKMAALKKAVAKAGLSDVKVEALPYDERLKAIWTRDYATDSCKWRASISADDIDKLPDVWVRKLDVCHMLSQWVKNAKWVPPDEIKDVVMKKFRKEVLSMEEERQVAKWYYNELPKKEKSVLDKVHWKDYVPSRVGWLDDIASEEVLNNPTDEMFTFAI